ncbi:hypothetical protein ACFE04_004440 [Oxalis oulophora]
MSASSSQKNLRIGIVGFETFGQFLAITIIKQGQTLRVTSRTYYSLLCNQMGISFYSREDGIKLTSVFASAQVLPENSDLLCTHPMFGPESGKNGWQGLTIVYEKVRVKDEATCSTFLNIFQSEVPTSFFIDIIKQTGTNKLV